MLHYFQALQVSLIILERKRVHSMTQNQNMSVLSSSILLNVPVSLTNIVANSPVHYQSLIEQIRPNNGYIFLSMISF